MKKINFLFFRSIELLVLILLISGCSNSEKTFWENGKLKSEIEKEDGRYYGIATWYYENGLKQHECNYVNDTLQGKSTRWYVNGKTHSIEHYKDNQLHGTVQKFDLNGKRVAEENYQLNTLHGSFKEFYPSGQVKVEGYYNKGMFDGQWLYYEDDGFIVGMGEFRNGSGRQRAWYRNGPLKRVVSYVDNVKHGQETWYRPDETLEKILTYEYGDVVELEENKD